MRLNAFMDYTFSSGNLDNIFKNFDFKLITDDDFLEVLSNKLKFEMSIRGEFKVVCENKIVKIEKLENNNFLESFNGFHNFLSRRILSQYFGDAIFLPAERGAINIFTKELFLNRNNLLDDLLAVEKKDDKGNDLRRILNQGKRYVLPVRESLKYVHDIERISEHKSNFFELADEIEEDLLDGKLIVKKNGQIIFVDNKAKSKQMSLDMAASSVKVLAGFIFLLRHSIKKGDILFIDEPELNLHPNTQAKLARIFVKMINKGIKLVVSTHSDYIIRELNNCILANEVNDESELKNYHLDKEDVEITRLYRKSASNKYITSEKIDIERDGFTVPSIDKVIEQQDELNQYLLEKLEKLEN